uniref:MFS domain-containing protein n=2 Tax=Strongyloides stercoralis TaxID=6248 RepID=A0A0K0DTI7_STRER
MASQIPTTLTGVQTKLMDTSKNLLKDVKNPLDSLKSNRYKQNENIKNNPLQIHSNFILEAMEKTSCVKISKRWQLALLSNIGFLIVFGIRCNFGAAKNRMAKNYTDPWGNHHVKEFNWTINELGVMESSFFYGYLVTQVPAGFLATKFAPNKLFGIAIGMASFFNIFLPFAFNSHSDTLVAGIQILQGLVQGVSYPAMHGCWKNWAPPYERSKLATTAFTGSYAGAVLGLPVSAFLVSYVDWSTPFYVYGIAGVIWAIFWFTMTFEEPAFHPTITEEEKNLIINAIGPVSHTHPTFSTIPWKAILTSKPVYAIIVANFARSWTFYLLLQNQLSYMKDVFNMRINDSGLIAALPHAVMGIVVLLGGQLADYLRSHKILSTTAVRKIFNCGGFGGEAFFMLFVAYTKSQTIAILSLILAVGCSGFAISGFNVNHLDIAPRYAAILMGFSNGIGTLAGLICPFVTESFTEHGSHGWVKVFLLASLIHFTGITFYGVYASGELQDWAEPKPEEEPWNTINQSSNSTKNNNTLQNYGTSNTTNINQPINSYPMTAINPNINYSSDIQKIQQPSSIPSESSYNYISGNVNPFTSAWDNPSNDTNNYSTLSYNNYNNDYQQNPYQ